MSYFRKGMGDTATPAAAAAPASSSSPTLPSLPDAGTVVGAALVYHGYKRTGSILWALIYGLAGKELPTVAGAVALAQGFGTKKPCP